VLFRSKYRTKIASALNALKVDFFETTGFIYVIFLVVLSFGFLLNIQNSTYLEMSFRHPDEVVIINPIFFNPLHFWNGVYDSQYNLLQILFSLPGLVISDYQWVAVGNRMISTVFAGLSVVYVYKIIGLFCKHYLQNILLIVMLLTIPGFWINLNIARPDWVMTGALIVSFYFLIKDHNNLKINFWLSIVFFAFACAIKFHSIQYLPVFAVFWLINFGHKKKWRLLLNMLVLFTVSFFVLNFEYLSLNNLKRFVSAVIWQLEGNATGYGSSKFIQIPLSNKIHTLKIIYAHILLLTVILMSHFYLIFTGFKNLKYRSLCALAIGNILVIVYNLFLVNKNWYNYYLTFLVIGFVLLFITILLLFNKRNKMIVVLSLMFISLQIYSYNKTYFDIKNDYLMSKIGEEEYQIQIEAWDQIAVILKENPKKEISVLKSMYIAFDYLDIKNSKNISTVDIGAKNLDLIYNKDVNYLTSFDIIIVRKYPESHINYILTENIESVLNQQNSEILFDNELTRVYKIQNIGVQ